MTVYSKPALDLSVKLAVEAERQRCTTIASKWQETGHILLHAGEMTKQELRSVKAVVEAIMRKIQTP